jgi:hypothetical protein
LEVSIQRIEETRAKLWKLNNPAPYYSDESDENWFVL